jgi:putative transposase
VRLGIKPEHIRLGRPSENGAHERFHKTLKAAATKPGSASFTLQQQRFDDFREEYNAHRPHSSLKGRKPPGEFYQRSSRIYLEKLPPLIYPERAMKRLVTTGGHIKWRNERIFLSSNMAGQYVGIIEDGENSFSVIYANLQLGRLDAETSDFTPELRWIDPM